MKIKFLILELAAMALLCSCSKSLESTYNTQETKIDSYINSLVSKNSDMRIVHNAGSHRAVLVEGEGEELSAKGTLGFYYAAYVFSNGITSSALFATNHQATAEAASWTGSTSYELEVMNLSGASLLQGLRNGLLGVKAGEECVIVFSGKYGYGRKSIGTIPANSALAYHIWVESINNE